RVLIVDDNATNRKILNHQTSSWGMIASEAESGERALELLRAGILQGEPYDIAVLDLMMPDMDSFQLAEVIKSDPAIASVALVLLPSFGKRGHGEAARQAGIAAYLQKPVRQSQLYNCLTEVLARAGSEPVAVSQLVTRHSLRESEGQQKGKSLSGLRILIAEDSLVNQMVILGQLENLGYQATVVVNGQEALKAVEKEAFDIILMDCQMPEMDGFKATSEIRQREGDGRHTTIIAITANALEGDREKCLAAGMDDYLSKPVRPGMLRQKLEQWTELINDAGNIGEQPVEITVAPLRKQLSKEREPFKRDRMSGVDLSVLAAYRKIQLPGKPDFVTELINLFIKDTAAQLKMLHEAVSRNDAEELRRVSHLLKGSSGNIGAGRIAMLTGELEAKEILKEDAEALLLHLDNEFGQVREALEAERIK
ncbi:MAG: response regulator, partial [Acidobacteria bacterium]|nr:response regulator [Acidobacteriota bacterium]